MVENVKELDSDKTAIAGDGTSFPTDPVKCQLFHRTDLNILYLRNAANTAWIEQTAIFGCEFNEASSEGESTTTDATYVGNEKLKLTTPSLPAGDYYIGWSTELANSNRDKCTMAQVELDDATVLGESCKPKVQTNNDYVGWAGFKIVTLTAAVHTIDIDFKAISDTAKIQRARIVMWRVA